MKNMCDDEQMKDKLSDDQKLVIFAFYYDEMKVEECSMRKGTQFTVEELFYNTPARLKYLKSDTSELSYVTDIVYKLALDNHKVAFSLKLPNKNIVLLCLKNVAYLESYDPIADNHLLPIIF